MGVKMGQKNGVTNGAGCVIIGPMTATLDKAGRLVLPKKLREKLRLRAGMVFKLDVVGDKIELEQELPKTEIAWRNGLPVVMGWEGFDAGKAVRDALEDLEERLAAPPEKA